MISDGTSSSESDHSQTRRCIHCRSAYQKKTCCNSLRDFCRIYLTAITRWCCISNSFHSSSRSRPHPPSSSPKFNRSTRDSSHLHPIGLSDSPDQEIEEEEEEETEEGNTMKGMYNNGDSLRGNNPASTSDRYFKYKSVDNFYPQYVTPPVSRNGSRKGGPPSPSFSYRSKSRGSIDSHHGYSRNGSSRRGTAPIMFSNSTGLMKPAPLHKSLDCTLEELCFGCKRRLRQIIQEDEMLTISVKPGWKKGTKVTFKEWEMRDRKPTCRYNIRNSRRKKHPLFRRENDDLELTIEIPLIKALTASEISIPLLGGNNYALMIDDIIYPGYHKLIHGQGMPNTKDHGKRGDLKIIFLVEFPSQLAQDQRSNWLVF